MRSDREIIDAARAAQEVRRILRDGTEEDARRPWPPGQEMIYVLYEARRNVFKIGRTCNIAERLSSHRSEAIGDVRVLALIACLSLSNSKRLERKLLMQCRKWRVPGKKEWFQVTPGSRRQLEQIVARCTHPAWVRWANRRLRPNAAVLRVARAQRPGVGLLG